LLCCRTSEVAAEKLSVLGAERDDLKTLLMATLNRLEDVDEAAQRADVSSTVMVGKVGPQHWGRCWLSNGNHEQALRLHH
jgi:hypothetical protein